MILATIFICSSQSDVIQGIDVTIWCLPTEMANPIIALGLYPAFSFCLTIPLSQAIILHGFSFSFSSSDDTSWNTREILDG